MEHRQIDFVIQLGFENWIINHSAFAPLLTEHICATSIPRVDAPHSCGNLAHGYGYIWNRAYCKQTTKNTYKSNPGKSAATSNLRAPWQIVNGLAHQLRKWKASSQFPDIQKSAHRNELSCHHKLQKILLPMIAWKIEHLTKIHDECSIITRVRNWVVGVREFAVVFSFTLPCPSRAEE